MVGLRVGFNSINSGYVKNVRLCKTERLLWTMINLKI